MAGSQRPKYRFQNAAARGDAGGMQETSAARHLPGQAGKGRAAKPQETVSNCWSLSASRKPFRASLILPQLGSASIRFSHASMFG